MLQLTSAPVGAQVQLSLFAQRDHAMNLQVIGPARGQSCCWPCIQAWSTGLQQQLDLCLHRHHQHDEPP